MRIHIRAKKIRGMYLQYVLHMRYARKIQYRGTDENHKKEYDMKRSSSS